MGQYHRIILVPTNSGRGWVVVLEWLNILVFSSEDIHLFIYMFIVTYMYFVRSSLMVLPSILNLLKFIVYTTYLSLWATVPSFFPMEMSHLYIFKSCEKLVNYVNLYVYMNVVHFHFIYKNKTTYLPYTCHFTKHAILIC